MLSMKMISIEDLLVDKTICEIEKPDRAMNYKNKVAATKTPA